MAIEGASEGGLTEYELCLSSGENPKGVLPTTIGEGIAPSNASPDVAANFEKTKNSAKCKAAGRLYIRAEVGNTTIYPKLADFRTGNLIANIVWYRQ